MNSTEMLEMKYTLLALFLLYATSVAADNAYAEPRNPYYNTEERRGSRLDLPVQGKSNVTTALDDVIDLILKQGFAGAIIVCLGIWTFRTDKVNRAMQKENIDKFLTISTECSGHMASVSARLENIEREIESTKQLEMLQATRNV
jgi:hypothetical protein